MKVFFRILDYSNNLVSKLIQFFLYSVLVNDCMPLTLLKNYTLCLMEKSLSN